MIEWESCPAVERTPGKVSGAWVFKGTRVPVRALFEASTVAGLAVRVVNKVAEGRPHIVDMIKNKEVDLVINTTEGKQAIRDSSSIRRCAENQRVYYTTTLAAANALCMAIRFGRKQKVRRLQELHEGIA